ncbi:hypothetical protein CQ020_07600 [Arthrobacter sp. MYb23]|uniref:hypothetical protein n=1 Tax=unclassified Arthrobacter TaxID=235627 RepID=UPI000CFC3A53|nr:MULTISPECIES: hypothetical protein [unclassified Arthrobacter]PRB43902.1 hypothetical protein CQ038_05840 [Arthrobacter sp. MYb51]PRB97508.1 hypothetical protein CQ020_07600 [Arthrobacter sp. MYb23]
MTTGSAASIHGRTSGVDFSEESANVAGPRELKLRVLGAAVSVVLQAGVTPDMYADLRLAWSRCLDQTGESVHAVSSSVAGSAHSDERAFRATVSSVVGSALVTGGTFREFASELTSAVTLAGITAGRGDLVMLHAAALADGKTGRAVALVGRSGMGKTTATRCLGAALGYVTDETVAVDGSGKIVPYPKPLSLIVEDANAPKRQISPDDLGLLVAPAATTLALIVLLDRNPDATVPKVTPLSHGEAMIELAPHTSSLGEVSQPVSRLCGILDATGGAVRVTYSEAADLAAVLPGLLERPAISKTWTSVLSGGTRPSEGQPRLDAARFTVLKRADLLDAVEIPSPSGDGTELIVMNGQGVIRLTGIGPAIWHALATPGDVDGIADRLAPHIGLPPGYESHLRSSVEKLRTHGILTDASPVELVNIA